MTCARLARQTYSSTRCDEIRQANHRRLAVESVNAEGHRLFLEHHRAFAVGHYLATQLAVGADLCEPLVAALLQPLADHRASSASVVRWACSSSSLKSPRMMIAERTTRRVGVIVSDSFGRAWRRGSVDVAVGVAGVQAVQDLRKAARQSRATSHYDAHRGC